MEVVADVGEAGVDGTTFDTEQEVSTEIVVRELDDLMPLWDEGW